MRQPSSRRATVFLDDVHDPLDEDVFGHGDYAQALADALVAAPQATTFGFFGEWGLGKTSVLRKLDERLPDDCAFVLFDAWRYGEDAFRRELLRDLVEQLVHQKALGRFDVEADLADLDIDVVRVREQFGIGWRRVLQFAVPLLALAMVFLAVNGVVVDTASGKASVVALAALLGWVATRFDGLLRLQARTETRRRLEDADRFTRRFREVLAAVRSDRLVIAIDNVDRLEATAALDVLSTVKTYLEPSVERKQRTWRQRVLRRPVQLLHVNFVVALDARAVVDHLAADGGDRQRAEEFLRKFFAVRTSMRMLLDDDLQEFVRSHVEPVVERWVPFDEQIERWGHGDDYLTRQVDTLCDVVVAGLRSNPRRVKQYINSVQMTMTLLDVRHRSGRLPTPPRNVALVGLLVLLEEEFPTVFEALLGNYALLDALHEAAQGIGGIPTNVDWSKLAPVLRACYDLPRDEVRSYLQLKVPRAEAALPDRERVLVALRAGDVAGVERRLDPAAVIDDGDDGPRTRPSDARYRYATPWADRLEDVIAHEVKGNRHDVVINVLRCALEVEVLRAHGAQVLAAIMRAVRDPEIRARLWRLPPHLVLNAVSAAPVARQVVDALAAAFAHADLPDERRRELSAALASKAELIEPARAEEIRQNLGLQPTLTQFDYAELVTARPDLFPDAGIAPLLESVNTDILGTVRPPPGADPQTLRPTEPVRVRRWLHARGHTVLAALIEARRVPLHMPAADALTTLLREAHPDETLRASVLTIVAEATLRAPAAADDALRSLLEHVKPIVAISPSPEALLALGAIAERLEIPPPEAQEVLRAFVRSFTPRKAAMLGAVDERLTGPLRGWLADALQELERTRDKDGGVLAARRRLDPQLLLHDVDPDTVRFAVEDRLRDAEVERGLIAALGKAGFEDRLHVAIQGVQLASVTDLHPMPDDPDRFSAKLNVFVAAQISADADDRQGSAHGESEHTVPVVMTIRLRRSPDDPEVVNARVEQFDVL